MARVYVSLGSNIDRERHLRAAVRGLRQRFQGLRLSTVYETEAVGFDGPPFYNLVAGFETDEPMETVVDALREIEYACGRQREGGRFSSRSLDIDLLLYDEVVTERPGLTLPRPDIERYPFVLGPLAEIAGDQCHPVTGETFAALWQRSAPSEDLQAVSIDLTEQSAAG